MAIDPDHLYRIIALDADSVKLREISSITGAFANKKILVIEYAFFFNIRCRFLLGFCCWLGPLEESHHVFALHWSSVLILKIVRDFSLHR